MLAIMMILNIKYGGDVDLILPDFQLCFGYASSKNKLRIHRIKTRLEAT